MPVPSLRYIQALRQDLLQRPYTMPPLLFVLLLLLAPHLHAVTNTSLTIPMRDGVGLYTELFLPDSAAAVGCILIRTPYGTASQAPTCAVYA